jgi:diguanylate cyclase (GGDEF)-like protein
LPGPLAERLHALLAHGDDHGQTVARRVAVGLGALALLLALHSLSDLNDRQIWQLAAGLAITLAASRWTVRIPGATHTVGAGEACTVLMLLHLGPGAATLASAIAAATGAWRAPRGWSRRMVDASLSAVAMTVAGHALQVWLDALPPPHAASAGLLLVCIGCALLQVAIQAGLVEALAHPLRAWRDQLAECVVPLARIAAAHAASAAVAMLLFMALRQTGIGMLAATAALIAMALVSLHCFVRWQDATEAADRATALAARHQHAQHHIAQQDSLTGLPNRQGLLARLAEAVDLSAAAPGHNGFGLACLDIDRFHLVNDSLGHAAGDALLQQVAERLRHTVGPGHTLARVAGDSFAVLMVGPGAPQAVLQLAGQMLATLQAPFCAAGTVLHVSASVGITTSALPVNRPADVLRDASMAMRLAKARGHGRLAVFDPDLLAQAQLHTRLQADLRHALQTDQIGLAYQPIFDLASGRVTAVEALARWSHPQLGPVSPRTAVAVADAAGLACALTDHLVQRACRQLQLWQRHVPGTDALAVHVNITGHDLVQPNLASRLMQVLQTHGLQPRHLWLELDGSTPMPGLDAGLPELGLLRQAGIGLSLDDFGSAFWSLGHLHRLPVDSLKINPSLVQALQAGHGTDADEAVVRAMVELGRSLGKAVVAEGIESASQLALLRAMGCPQGQGYHLAPPLSPDDVPALLAQTGLAQPPSPAAMPANVPAPSTLRH